MFSSKWRQFAAFAFVSAIALNLGTAYAACKGQTEAACGPDNSCTWVSPYERKDGVKVGGYCRNKSKKATPHGPSTGSAERVSKAG